MDYRAAENWLGAVRARVESVMSKEGGGLSRGAVRIGYTGGPVFLSEIASGMERDLRNSVISTVTVICVLFWLAHRTLRPLAFLVAALGLTLVGTMAVGGWVLGTLNVISGGFGAVMLGLVVDYGLVGYQEARAEPGADVAEIRRRIRPGIGWSAVTTAGTFLSLGFAGLPGLGQLGLLTAIGLGLGAVVMVWGFLPLAMRRMPVSAVSVVKVGGEPGRASGWTRAWGGRATGWVTAGVLGLAVTVLIGRGLPGVTSGTDPLRPRRSGAYDTLAEVQRAMGREGSETWLVFRDVDADRLAERMESTGRELERMEGEGRIRGHQLPGAFWPRPERVRENRERAARLLDRMPLIRGELEAAGFAEGSWQLAETMMSRWREWVEGSGTVPLWPGNAGARWMADRMSAREPDGSWLAVGVVEGGEKRWDGLGLPEGVWVTGWDRLGDRLLERVMRRVGWMTAGMATVLVGCLWLAFRRWSEVVLGLSALGTAFLLLIAGMAITGSSWNLLNLVAIPLVLGTSVDSMIHVQLAMRRSGGDLGRMWRTTGTALVLCAGANIAGFGSLAWSSNAGLASLDVVCAGGVAGVLAVSTLLLPQWWLAWHGAGHTPGPVNGSAPSALYGALGWKLGCGLARRLPRGLLVAMARGGAWMYRQVRPDRFAVVVENLLPWASGDRLRAIELARENFSEFAIKLVDLWRYEAGVKGAGEVEPASGWEAFHSAVGSGRGVLLVTPHLGQWELGGPLLVGMGVRPLVLSAVEPGADLTGMRASARSRQGVETLVVGEDPFAFVTVIRRLQEGGVVALLVDRPPESSGVVAEVAGRELRVSVAGAELARATGCVVLPVYVVREHGRYRAHALSAVEYDRASLGNREARREFAGAILRVFEPVLRQFPEQWFHFVPVWNADAAGGVSKEGKA